MILTEGKLSREPKAPLAKIVKQNLTQVPCVDPYLCHLVLTSQRARVSTNPKERNHYHLATQLSSSSGRDGCENLGQVHNG
jgi:hypothetical protein